jgi:hypothetical protein
MQRRWLLPIITLLAAGAAHADVPLDDELEPQDFSGVDVAPPREDKKAKAPQRDVDVEGIEGTMSEFDVRVVLEARDADFDACHDRYRGGSGRIVFQIHINANGDVGHVKAHPSKVRSHDLIDCYSEVVSTSHFNKPHGGYADVKWTTKVGRSRKKKGSDLFGYDRPHRFDAPATGGEKTARSEKRRRHHRHHSSRKNRG